MDSNNLTGDGLRDIPTNTVAGDVDVVAESTIRIADQAEVAMTGPQSEDGQKDTQVDDIEEG